MNSNIDHEFPAPFRWKSKLGYGLNVPTSLYVYTMYPSHSQSVERAVKLVSEASQCVYGQARRHQHILGKVKSRKLRKSFSSKGYYEENYEEIL